MAKLNEVWIIYIAQQSYNNRKTTNTEYTIIIANRETTNKHCL